MKRRNFILTSAGIAGGIGVYTYSTAPKISDSSIETVEKPEVPGSLGSNQYFDIPINPFEIQGENLSTSSDITVDYELRRSADDSTVTAALFLVL